MERKKLTVLKFVINYGFCVFYWANKATVVLQFTRKMSPRTPGISLEKAWLSIVRNDETQQPRLMKLRWLLIRAAVVINYLPTTQIFLYLGKVLIYLILFAGRSR